MYEGTSCIKYGYFLILNINAKLLYFILLEEYRPELTSSYSMMRLIAFCTCLIRLLGMAFSTLRLQRYKEFNKRVGRCIR